MMNLFRRHSHAARPMRKRLLTLAVFGFVLVNTVLGGHAGHALVAPSVQGQNTTSSLLIAPTITYSTYLGGRRYEWSPDKDVGNDIAVDATGNIYVVGSTNSLGRYDSDIFVRKFDPSGSTLLYETFLDSNGSDDAGFGIAVDAARNAYVTGRLGDWWFRQGRGALVAKLSPAGVPLYRITLGADSNSGFSGDFGARIAVDEAGNAYVAGLTYRPLSQPFPTTPGAFQKGFGGGDQDAFVAKVNPQGKVVYATLLGGSGDEQAWGIAIRKVGAVYHAYVTGETDSVTDFPTKPGAFQSTFGGGVTDGFVTQLDDTGSALVYSTYLGGNGTDKSFALAVDGTGNAYLTGLTAEYPTVPNNFPLVKAFQSTYGGKGSNPALANAFVAKLNPTGSALVYSSYMGGAGSNLSDAGHAIKVDSAGYAYLTGFTETRPDIYTGIGFPIVNAFQSEHAGSVSDAFVAKLTPQGALVYSSYLGGNMEEGGNGLVVDGMGTVYVTGSTSSQNFPVTEDAFQPTPGGGNYCNLGECFDAFVTKIGNLSPTLTVTKAGTGSGTVSSSPTGVNCGADCTESYNSGTVVTLTATPATGSTLAGWSGDVDCVDGVVTMTNSKTCTATFTLLPPSPKITVITPNGGESWPIGTTRTIRWNSSGVSGNVGIQLSRNGGASWTTLFSSTANDGVQNWTVSGPVTTQARIRVRSVSAPSVLDASNKPFTIR